MAKIIEEESRLPQDPEDFQAQAREYVLLKKSLEALEARQKELREKLFEKLDLEGQEDSSGNVFIELSNEIEGIRVLEKQRRTSRKLDENIAEAMIMEKGLEETLYKTIRVIDEDAIMAAHYNDQLTEDEIDQMFPSKVTWALMTKKKQAMSGIRSEEELLKGFEGLDLVPGSKKTRRPASSEAGKKRGKLSKEQNGWDENPTIKLLKGIETEVFPISALAKALDKQIVTIRLWEKKGYIPIAPYRLRSKSLKGNKVMGNRVYTRVLIEITIEEFVKRGLLGSARVEWSLHPDLTDVLVKRWKDVL